MKNITFLVPVFLLLSLSGCGPGKQVAGTYGYNDELNLSKDSVFTYYLRGEVGLLRYSKGKYHLHKNKLILLSDYNTADSLKKFKTRIEATNATDAGYQLIPVPEEKRTYIKYAIKINDDPWLDFNQPVNTQSSIRTVRLKSYEYFHGGLPGTRALIDTLYTDVLNLNDKPSRKHISFFMNVTTEDFFRIPLNDTLKIRGRGKLRWKSGMTSWKIKSS